MIELTAIVLFVLWYLGFLSAYTLTGYFNAALVLGLCSVLIRVYRGRDIMS